MGITKHIQLEEMEQEARDAALRLLSNEDYQQVLSINANAKRKRAQKPSGTYVHVDKLIRALDELATPTDRMTLVRLAASMDDLLVTATGYRYGYEDDPYGEEFECIEAAITDMQLALRQWYGGAHRQNVEAARTAPLEPF